MIQTDEDSVQAIPVNATLTSDSTKIGLYQIGKAQQGLQLTLFNKLGGEVPQVVDVIITNIIYLGLMTPTRFQFIPKPDEEAPVEEATEEPVGNA